ncbi:MAG: LemA family protein, partial [Candidatus Hydrothermarchaeales archaeon]
ARQFYNDITTRYNIRIQTVPSNIVAALFNFGKKDLFETPQAERAVPKVEF